MWARLVPLFFVVVVVVIFRPVGPSLTLGTSRVQNGVVFVLNFGAGACWAEGASGACRAEGAPGACWTEGAPGACFDERGAPGSGEAHHHEGVIVALTALILPVCRASVWWFR